MSMYTCLCNNSRVEAADKKAHSAAFTRKSPAKFLTLSDTVSHSSQGIIPEGSISTRLCFQTVRSMTLGSITAMVQLRTSVACSLHPRNPLQATWTLGMELKNSLLLPATRQ